MLQKTELPYTAVQVLTKVYSHAILPPLFKDMRIYGCCSLAKGWPFRSIWPYTSPLVDLSAQTVPGEIHLFDYPASPRSNRTKFFHWGFSFKFSLLLLPYERVE